MKQFSQESAPAGVPVTRPKMSPVTHNHGMNSASGADTKREPRAWPNLYAMSGIATLILLLYSLVTMVVMLTLGLPPETTEGVFAMLQANKFVGLLRLDLLTVCCMPLYYLLFLGLYTALKNAHHDYAALATLLGCAGLTLFLATPSALSLAPLSDKFAAATDAAQRAQLLAAGEALIASDMWRGTGALIGGVLLQTATTLISIVMLSSKAFTKATAYVGIVTHGLDLLHMLVGFFLPELGAMLLMVGGTLYLVWFPLLARDLFRLSQRPTKE
ncbi:MAG TPA: hypothetical protein PKH77_08740 [Anaerolineae bacterium]|nr:hypothetical protein [Anaerolineae bacterium]